MLGFGSKKTSSISKQQALSARPVQLVKCELTETPDGGAKLQIPLKQTTWSNWLFRLPQGAMKTFELDSLGLYVWRSCDGKTSVQQIIRRLAKEHGLTLREVEVATVRFLEVLVKKGLVGMTVADPKKDEG
jgi:Coenzyme PQQ synthesis protein D (PqqD)